MAGHPGTAVASTRAADDHRVESKRRRPMQLSVRSLRPLRLLSFALLGLTAGGACKSSGSSDAAGSDARSGQDGGDATAQDARHGDTTADAPDTSSRSDAGDGGA